MEPALLRYDKEVFLNELLEINGLSSTQMVFVGDTQGDIKSAILAGVTPVGFDGGFGGVELLLNTGAQHIITDHNQIFSFSYLHHRLS